MGKTACPHLTAVDAWVLLPDHLHCIWTLPPDDAGYPLRWGLIKRMVSLACAQHYHRADWMMASKTKHRESTFWQSFRVLLTPLTYIHVGNGVIGNIASPRNRIIRIIGITSAARREAE